VHGGALALEARRKFGWASRVPRAVFEDAVLPYANVNEARSDWRQLLWNTLSAQEWVGALPNASTLEAVALAVNKHVWTALGKLSGKAQIVFKGEQTPLIYDPLSTILFGYASCTGVSITYVDALRTLGVPARVVGTPAWHGKQSDGNHNWVEVYLGEESGWRFIEAAPAGPGETFSNPCDKWFCNKAHFGGSGTKVFAAVYRRSGAGGGVASGAASGAVAANTQWYPMAWDLANHGVAGVERSAYYDATCSAC